MTKIFSNLAGTHESAHLRSSVHFKQDKLRETDNNQILTNERESWKHWERSDSSYTKDR